MQEKMERDIKDALLSGDRQKAETLKGLKNALQYEVLSADKDQTLSDEQIQKVLARESKKRQEAADLYKQGGNNGRAGAELAEKAIIDSYLPEQVDEAAIETTVAEEVSKLDSPSMADMGKIIGGVKAKLGAGADGATIAQLAKQALEQK
ncbi:MAG TPA: GatB/YqeY domain-containing protein [Candidatus Saccharimonadales bacterium]|nr:GatB/YqeY domain-containing protein [Candidatus Saccharimonadales bacterium]